MRSFSCPAELLATVACTTLFFFCRRYLRDPFFCHSFFPALSFGHRSCRIGDRFLRQPFYFGGRFVIDHLWFATVFRALCFFLCRRFSLPTFLAPLDFFSVGVRLASPSVGVGPPCGVDAHSCRNFFTRSPFFFRLFLCHPFFFRRRFLIGFLSSPPFCLFLSRRRHKRLPFFLLPRRMGNFKAQAHNTST